MGLFQKAVETYDASHQLVGVIDSEDQEPLVPVSHILAKPNLEISLTEDGCFDAAVLLDKKAPKIIIPATVESGGRSGKNPAPHPLCDKLEYIAPNNSTKHDAYIKQLSDWVNSEFSHPMLQAILKYVEGGTILEDLAQMNLVSLDEKGITEANKLFICWKIIGLGEAAGECWKNQMLFDSFICWYSKQIELQPQALCMIDGAIEPISRNHPKGIFALHGNAKLVSANDTSGFTFRGRFTSGDQAATVGYFASQKAHNALRWLIAKQRVWYGGRAFICWSVQGAEIPHATGLFARPSKPINAVVDYRKELLKTLEGYKTRLPSGAEGVVIAVFDAATSGRLSLVYYNELMGSDYLNRLYNWDLTSLWPNGGFGIQSPLLRNIVNFAFGTPREEKGQVKFAVDDKVMAQQMQRLITCRVDGAHLPLDIEQALVHRASNLGRYDRGLAANILFTACAVIRKYHIDVFGEDIDMALDEEKQDRSYQFGRLLAVYEKVERDTYGYDDKREPNAMRYQSVFCQRPLHIATTIQKELDKAYFPILLKNDRVGSYFFYKKEIGQILDRIHSFPEKEWDKPLKDTYLMGYYLERNKLYTRKKDAEEVQED